MFIKWLLFAGLCFIWGSSFILMKIGKQGLSAPQIATLRIFSASLAFLPLAIFHVRKLPKEKIGLVILTGLLGNLFPAFLFAAAILKIDSSLTGILNSLTPICVVTIASVFFGDKISRQKLFGVLTGFLGLCLLTFTQKDVSLNNLGYAFLVVLATFSYGLNVNVVGHYLKNVKPLQATSVSLACMSIPSGILLWQQGFFDLDFSDTIIQKSALSSIVLGLAGSAVATLLFYTLVQKAGGLFASLVTYGIPFIALFWGYIDGEHISLLSIACLLLILMGVFLANRPEKMRNQTDRL